MDTADDVVVVKWILFDKTYRKPMLSKVPRHLYEDGLPYVSPLFQKELKARYKVSAEECDIMFWKVSGISFSRCIDT